MKIKNLYEKYDIMPQLAEHQLRVGGIAHLITRDWKDRTTAHECVVACLVHDMGNIVKFGSLTDPYWQRKQKQYQERYSTTDAHITTKGILMDANLPKYADYIEEEAQLYHSTPTTPHDFAPFSKPAILVLYADLRVTPQSVVSIEERTRDLIARYNNKRTEMLYGPPLEQYVQQFTPLSVAKITEADVRPLFDDLLTLTI